MKKLSTVTAGAALIALGTLAVAPAQAAILTYNWVANGPDTSAFGSFTFDNQVSDSAADDPLVGIYEGAILGFSLTNPSLNFSRTVTADQFTENTITLDLRQRMGFADLTGAGNTFGIPGGRFVFSIDFLSDILPLTDRLVDFDPTSPLWSTREVTSQVFAANGTPLVNEVRDIDEITLVAASVPEPTSLLTLGLIGALGALGLKNKKSEAVGTKE